MYFLRDAGKAYRHLDSLGLFSRRGPTLDCTEFGRCFLESKGASWKPTTEMEEQTTATEFLYFSWIRRRFLRHYSFLQSCSRRACPSLVPFGEKGLIVPGQSARCKVIVAKARCYKFGGNSKGTLACRTSAHAHTLPPMSSGERQFYRRY